MYVSVAVCEQVVVRTVGPRSLRWLRKRAWLAPEGWGEVRGRVCYQPLGNCSSTVKHDWYSLCTALQDEGAEGGGEVSY